MVGRFRKQQIVEKHGNPISAASFGGRDHPDGSTV
jgi:hypothetical protein